MGVNVANLTYSKGADVWVDVAEVQKGLLNFGIFGRKKVRDYFEKSAGSLESYMKNNAPWGDRTGDARRGLSADVEEDDNSIKIVLSHSVPYGFYLECTMNKNFAILEPTARLKGPDVIKGLEGLYR